MVVPGMGRKGELDLSKRKVIPYLDIVYTRIAYLNL